MNLKKVEKILNLKKKSISKKKKKIEYQSPKRDRDNNISRKKSNIKINLSKNSKDKIERLNISRKDTPRKVYSKKLTSRKKKEKKSKKNISEFESEELSEQNQSGVNNTQKLNISSNTISEELVLKDEDLDKLVNYINQKKDEKFKTIPEEENENYINDYNSYFQNMNGINIEKKITKEELIERIKSNDEEIIKYLEKLIYSKLLSNKEILKRKKRHINLVYNGENNEFFKIHSNSIFMQNFFKDYMNDSEDADVSEDQNESENTDEKEDLKERKSS